MNPVNRRYLKTMTLINRNFATTKLPVPRDTLADMTSCFDGTSVVDTQTRDPVQRIRNRSWFHLRDNPKAVVKTPSKMSALPISFALPIYWRDTAFAAHPREVRFRTLIFNIPNLGGFKLFNIPPYFQVFVPLVNTLTFIRWRIKP